MSMYSKEIAQIALGKSKAPLVFKNAKVVQVFTNEIISADIAVCDGMIVGVGDYEGVREVDLNGKYVCPGFIDSHLHLESTLVNPAELILQAGLKGTTTFIVDPHEAANVSGTAGIDYILNETENSHANVYVMLPSCVPAGPFEDNGFSLGVSDMRTYTDNPRVLGLGEVMDCGAVISCDEDMLGKIDLFREKNIDGHAGYLSEKETDCYVLAGISTDHECCTFEDALREMRSGMQILIREGTAAKNLESIIKGVIEHKLPCHQLAFCTDDKHIEDIQSQGHISYNVRKAIELGLDPIESIKIATLYPAKKYGLKHLGAVAPGYQADLLVMNDLNCVDIEQVYYKGEKVVQSDNGERSVPKELLNTVNVKIEGIQELKLPMSSKKARVMQVVGGEILTKEIFENVTVEDGLFVADETYQKIAVFERHHATGKKGLGIVKGFSIKNGAIASTVGHDSHNLIVVGDNDDDMYKAVMALIECGGGYAVVRSGEEPKVLPLEIMGLISTKGHEDVKSTLKEMIELARQMGVPGDIDPFITLSFLALPVIPQLRVTTRGLYNVIEREFKPVSINED
ncbi:MAG: adenine deaminase [Oscillospiraceae bacterium]|nr:adenine deaminase [Oscillospiraceae bacterium]